MSSWIRWLAVACLAAFGVAYAAGVPGQGTWVHTLKPRDLNGDGLTDAYYDTALNITWLRNADPAGLQFWANGTAFADSFSFGGYSDWRLPTMVDTGARGCDWAYGGTDCGYNVQTKLGPHVFSEFEYLFAVELGNTAYCDVNGVCGQGAWGLTNTGPFQNMHSDFYWIGHDYGAPGVFAWYYYAATIYQSYAYQNLAMYLMLVRPGDVTPAVSGVPEAGTEALMAAGLALLGLVRFRRRAAVDKGELTP